MLEFITILSQLKEVLWVLVALVGIAFISISLIKAHFNPEYTRFNLLDAFTQNGIFGGSKSRLNIAFIITSWVLIWVSMKITTITSDFVLLFTSYGSLWVVDRIDSRRKNVLPTLGGEGNISKSKDD